MVVSAVVLGAAACTGDTATPPASAPVAASPRASAGETTLQAVAPPGTHAADAQRPDPALERVCQLVIDARGLDGYFHVADAPDRKPLFVVESEQVPRDVRLTKFGVPVQVAPRQQLQEAGRPYLDFTRIEIRGDQAEVQFAYPVEGLVGHVTLRRQGGDWSIEGEALSEQ